MTDSAPNIGKEEAHLRLEQAIIDDEEETIRSILENDGNGSISDLSPDECERFLNFASHQNNTYVAEQIVARRGYSKHADDPALESPLFLAMSAEFRVFSEILVNAGASLEARGASGITPLMLAAQKGMTPTVQLMLEKGANVTAKDNFHRTALHHASKEGRIEVVRLLLQQRHIDLNGQDNLLGRRPLHYARNHLMVVQELIRAGASVDAPDSFGNTALFFTDDECSSELLQHGATVNAENNKGDTPLHDACFLGSVERVRFLLEHGADPRVRNQRLRTPLHRLAFRQEPGALEILPLLLQHGADIEATTVPDEKTVLLLACECRNDTLVEALFNSGSCNVQAVDFIGNNALHLACQGRNNRGDPGQLRIVQMLLAHQINVNSINNQGNTPIIVSATRRHDSMALDVILELLRHKIGVDGSVTASPRKRRRLERR